MGRKPTELIVGSDVNPHTMSLHVTEALHDLCRPLGFEEAERRVNLLLDSGYLNVVSQARLSMLATLCRCLFPLSLADCRTLALAKTYGIPALFYRPERVLQPLLGKSRGWPGGEALFLTGYP